jgi:carbamoyltransferase
MGLSAYGKYRPEFLNLFYRDNLGNTNKLSTELIDNFHASINRDLQEQATNDINETNYSLYADYAYAVQDQSQASAFSLINKWVEKTGIYNVCVTGGYGLNVVANTFYKEKLQNVNFYFEPIADDTGNSIGGALLYYRAASKDKNLLPIDNTFFHGKNYSLDNIPGKSVSIDHVADLLKDQKTIAIYYKQAEAGPRALGHRSILFDPRNPQAKAIVNVVKKREWYRPFAAVMLEEDANKFFYIIDSDNSKSMTMSFRSKPIAEKIVPGILHVDKSCRVQIVADKSEPIYRLLEKFKEKTGVGILLNTSFNLAGKPLVETPEDAISTLDNSNLDGIWFPEKQMLLLK